MKNKCKGLKTKRPHKKNIFFYAKRLSQMRLLQGEYHRILQFATYDLNKKFPLTKFAIKQLLSFSPSARRANICS